MVNGRPRIVNAMERDNVLNQAKMELAMMPSDHVFLVNLLSPHVVEGGRPDLGWLWRTNALVLKKSTDKVRVR